MVRQEITHAECWVNYRDFVGLEPGSSQFGTPADLAWSLVCVSEPACVEDLDGSGDVGFGDILRVLAAWGNVGGPEDLDGSGTVGFGDLLLVLAAWGPCGG